LTSAGGLSLRATLFFFFLVPERADESDDALYLAEADAGFVTIPVVLLGKVCDGGCGAGTGAADRTSGMDIFGTTLVILA